MTTKGVRVVAIAAGLALGAVVLCAVGLLAGGVAYWQFSPCGVRRTSRAIEAMNAAYFRFQDIETVADSTPRISLSGPISELQAVKREFDAVKVPACLEQAHKSGAAAMAGKIDLLVDFMADGDDVFKQDRPNLADLEGEYYGEIERIPKCRPFCASGAALLFRAGD